jgi:hypothetical protein
MEHHKLRRCGACALWALRKHRVDDLDDELLTCARQLGDCGDLLLQLGGRAALGGLGRFADEFFDGHAERLGQRRQGRNGHAPPAGLEGRDLLLGDADEFAELRLRQALHAALFGGEDRDTPDVSPPFRPEKLFRTTCCV